MSKNNITKAILSLSDAVNYFISKLPDQERLIALESSLNYDIDKKNFYIAINHLEDIIKILTKNIKNKHCI